MNAKSIWAYQDNFDFKLDVGENSPFYVSLEGERGEYSRRDILTEFSLDPTGKLRPEVKLKQTVAILFGGHLGSGKSTELKQLAVLFRQSYTVDVLELTKVLDINNLRFSDLLIALAHRLVSVFQGYSLTPASVFVTPVTDWFESRIISKSNFKDLELAVKTEAKAEGGIPFLVKLLASMTAKFKTGASYKEELRTEVRNGFTQLVDAFNKLMAHANDLLATQGKGPLLFIVDGTDKLKREDSAAFFQSDVNQLFQIQTNLIICAPISVLLEDGGSAQRFPRMRLPMVKVFDRDESERPTAVAALMKLIAQRMPLSYFDSEDTVKYLVRQSGGHPRDLIRLVRTCFSKLDQAPITQTIAQQAVALVASEYKRNVHRDDWADLVGIDQSLGDDTDRTEERLRLLYDLVLLEYNSYWWRSHPLVRSLPSYQKAKAEIAAAAIKPTPSVAA